MFVKKCCLFAWALSSMSAASAYADSQPPVLVDPALFPFALPANSFGRAVALEPPFAAVAAEDRAFVYLDAGGAYLPDAVLEPSDQPTADFGMSIAMVGETVFVGAPEVFGGAVYQFQRQAPGFWVQVNKLAPAGSTGRFGWDIDCSDDVLVVGAIEDPPHGAVYVYRDQGQGVWQFQQKVLPPVQPASDQFGRHVSVDGLRFATGNNNAPGKPVHVFVEQQGVWIEEDRIEPNPSGFLEVALASDRLMIGAPSQLTTYLRSGSVWSPEVQLPYPAYEKMGDLSGSVALLQGNVAGAGTAHRLIDFQGGGWVDINSFTGSEGTFQAQVAIDGAQALVTGASGACYIVDLAAQLAVQVYCTAKANSQGCTPTICFDDASAPSASSVEPYWIRATNVLNNKNGLYFYSYGGPAALPFLGGVLCALPPLRRTPIQFSAGNSPPDDCSGGHAIDFQAWARSGSDPMLQPGVTVNGQFWMRDPNHSDGTAGHLRP